MPSKITLNKAAREHFKKTDPILYKALEKVGKVEMDKPRSPKVYFEHLVRSIVFQQLSGKAANTIYSRFMALLPKGKVTPETILKLSDEEIRGAGISGQKMGYIRDLSQKVKDKEVDLNNLQNLSDEEVISELTKVKGIGRWTAEMFLMFTLTRPDIFSHGDLGLRNAIKMLYKLENPTQEQVELICAKWSPHRTYACRILWESLDNR
mgnify:CR=1 FL=1